MFIVKKKDRVNDSQRVCVLRLNIKQCIKDKSVITKLRFVDQTIKLMIWLVCFTLQFYFVLNLIQSYLIICRDM